MKNKSTDIYDYIGIIAMVATPLAASIVFGWTVGTAVYLHTQNQIAAVLGGVGAAVGLETIGIYAGHVVMELWHEKRNGRFWLALSFLVAYSIAGIYELRSTELWILFVIAPVVYLIVALRHSVRSERTATDVSADDDKQWKRKVSAENRQHKREMERLKLELHAKNKRQDTGKIPTKTPPNVPQHSGNIPSDWRQVTTDQRHELAHLTREERNVIMPELAPRTRREWHNRLDEVAAQNGHYAGATK